MYLCLTGSFDESPLVIHARRLMHQTDAGVNYAELCRVLLNVGRNSLEHLQHNIYDRYAFKKLLADAAIALKNHPSPSRMSYSTGKQCHQLCQELNAMPRKRVVPDELVLEFQAYVR